MRRAREAGLVEVNIHDLRGFAHDRHRTVDDRPFGGGEGMVLKPEPIFECLEAIVVATRAERSTGRARESVVLLSPQGELFDQRMAAEMAGLDRLVLICGRYDGVDERVSEFVADREVSIGDYVLSGGELAACLMVDAVTRLVPGALGNEASAQQESFTHAETARPPVFSVLLNHFPVQRQATSDRGRRHDRHQNHPRTGRLSEDSFPAPR